MSTNNYYTPSGAQKICLCVRGACVLINLEDTSLNMVSIENSCRGTVKLMRTSIRLLAQPKSIRSIIDATQREQQHGSA